ncbi:MAG: hypothetical protein KAI24_22420 [Planctomycetes bacterium]|nr:hypothetical protein [Planctomycetota bacterium]
MEDGDILDAFDDAEDLTRSIERGKKGPWNDDAAVFEDPKVAALKKEMSGAQLRDYQQRRMIELQKRAAAAEKRKDARRQPPSAASDWELDMQPQGDRPSPVQWGDASEWQESGSSTDAAPAAEQPQAQWGDPPVWNEQGGVEQPLVDRRDPNRRPDPNNPIVHARRATDRAPLEKPEPVAEAPRRHTESDLVHYVPSILAAILVFVVATVVHGTLDGWNTDLVARALLAMGLTGVLWRRLRAGRLSAMAIGAVVYTTVFVPSDRLGTPENLFALILGLLAVVAGSGLIGMQRDEFGGQRR